MGQSSLFDLEADYEEINDGVPEDYAKYRLIDFSDKDRYSGRPQMGAPYSFEIENDEGKTITKHACKLYLIDDENEEALEVNFNIKKEDDVQENIFRRGVLYDFVASLRDLEDPGCMDGFNVFKKLNLKSIRDVVNTWENLTIEVKEVTGKYHFNSLRVIKAVDSLE